MQRFRETIGFVTLYILGNLCKKKIQHYKSKLDGEVNISLE